jgi:hypothetical protein
MSCLMIALVRRNSRSVWLDIAIKWSFLCICWFSIRTHTAVLLYTCTTCISFYRIYVMNKSLKYFGVSTKCALRVNSVLGLIVTFLLSSVTRSPVEVGTNRNTQSQNFSCFHPQVPGFWGEYMILRWKKKLEASEHFTNCSVINVVSITKFPFTKFILRMFISPEFFDTPHMPSPESRLSCYHNVFKWSFVYNGPFDPLMMARVVCRNMLENSYMWRINLVHVKLVLQSDSPYDARYIAY